MEKGWSEIGRVAVMYTSGKEEVPKLPGGVFTGGEKKRRGGMKKTELRSPFLFQSAKVRIESAASFHGFMNLLRVFFLLPRFLIPDGIRRE